MVRPRGGNLLVEEPGAGRALPRRDQDRPELYLRSLLLSEFCSKSGRIDPLAYMPLGSVAPCIRVAPDVNIHTAREHYFTPWDCPAWELGRPPLCVDWKGNRTATQSSCRLGSLRKCTPGTTAHFGRGCRRNFANLPGILAKLRKFAGHFC